MLHEVGEQKVEEQHHQKNKIRNDAKKRSAPVGTSKAAKAFTKRTWAVRKRFLSRIGTVSFCRAHTKGGYMVDKTDILDSSRSVAGLAKGQKHKDSIVHRCAAVIGLDPANDREADAYYGPRQTGFVHLPNHDYLGDSM